MYTEASRHTAKSDLLRGMVTLSPIRGLACGSLRGRKLQYSGDIRTRPMKDRVRESVFNLLGPQVAGSHAIAYFYW